MMDWEVVYSYSRKQAIEDGILIDVTDQASAAGFKIPVAITSSLWYGHVVPRDIPGQSVEGRLHDVLWMLFLKARRSDEDTILFEVLFQMTEEKQEAVKIKAIIGPGDTPEPVLTILYPWED